MNCNFDFVIDRVQMLFSKPTKKVNLGRSGLSKKAAANNDKKDASAWDEANEDSKGNINQDKKPGANDKDGNKEDSARSKTNPKGNAAGGKQKTKPKGPKLPGGPRSR